MATAAQGISPLGNRGRSATEATTLVARPWSDATGAGDAVTGRRQFAQPSSCPHERVARQQLAQAQAGQTDHNRLRRAIGALHDHRVDARLAHAIPRCDSAGRVALKEAGAGKHLPCVESVGAQLRRATGERGGFAIPLCRGSVGPRVRASLRRRLDRATSRCAVRRRRLPCSLPRQGRRSALRVHCRASTFLPLLEKTPPSEACPGRPYPAPSCRAARATAIVRRPPSGVRSPRAPSRDRARVPGRAVLPNQVSGQRARRSGRRPIVLR